MLLDSTGRRGEHGGHGYGERRRRTRSVVLRERAEEGEGSRERARGSRGSAWRLRGRPGGSGKQEVAGARAGVRRTHASHPSGAGWETTGRWAWWAATVPGRPGKRQVFSLFFYVNVFLFFL